MFMCISNVLSDIYFIAVSICLPQRTVISLSVLLTAGKYGKSPQISKGESTLESTLKFVRVVQPRFRSESLSKVVRLNATLSSTYRLHYRNKEWLTEISLRSLLSHLETLFECLKMAISTIIIQDKSNLV